MIYYRTLADINLIRDAANTVLAQRVQPPSTSGQDHFMGPSILVELIEILYVSINVELGD